MGILRIETSGSFPVRHPRKRVKLFSAQRAGHAQAVAAAIQYLSEDVLPRAIELDHKLQKQGATPNDTNFGKYSEES